VLFCDCTVKLAEQLQMATDLSTWFNRLAVEVGAAEINLEDLRTGLQPEMDRRVAASVYFARLEMLGTFGKAEEMQAAMVRSLLLAEPNSGRVTA
jgi:hypothetical protein